MISALPIAIVMLASAPTLVARPNFVVMNVAKPDSAPAKFGYDVACKVREGSVHFSLKLDANASAKLHDAVVFFHTRLDNRPHIPIEIKKVEDGSVSLSFSIPEELLRFCVLHIDSGRLRQVDPTYNFAGYRLRLDNFSEFDERSVVATPEKNGEAEQGADQPATSSVSDSEGGDQPQPESEPRPR